MLTGTPAGRAPGGRAAATRRRARRRAEVVANGGVAASARREDGSGGTGGKCAVCLEAYVNPTSTRCGHVFCAKCVLAAIKHSSKCPTCRKKVTKSQIHRVYL